MIQPTALCNLDCGYCYVPDRQDARRLPVELLERLLVAVSRSQRAIARSELNILWHAGEPLAAGLDYFRTAFALTDRILAPRWRVRHSIQTNATLITAEWCELFVSRRVSLGVSLDGPADLHDANRKTRGRRGSFAAVMTGIELLRSHGLPISALAVLSSQNIGEPDRMFRFFVDQHIRRVAFNVEEIEGPHRRSSLLAGGESLAGARARYREFMGRIAALNAAEGWPLRVREFASLAQRIRRRREPGATAPDAPERRAGGILTMTRFGTLYSWSPELASVPASAEPSLSLGNIRDVDSIDDLLDSEPAQTIQREIDRGVDLCRQQCRYFGVCGGGSPGNKLYERGMFAATETLKCALQTQELTDLVLATFGR